MMVRVTESPFIRLPGQPTCEVELLHVFPHWPRGVGARMYPANGLASTAKFACELRVPPSLTYLELLTRKALQCVKLGHNDEQVEVTCAAATIPESVPYLLTTGITNVACIQNSRAFSFDI
jgi:hypothetical protein